MGDKKPIGVQLSDEIDGARLRAVEDTWTSAELKEFTSEHPAENGAEVKIRYRAFPRPNPKAAVVISSGRTECMFKYDETIHDLNEAGYSVYIHDHRGQGFSDTTTGEAKDNNGHGPGHVASFEHFVDDLHAFVTGPVRQATGNGTKLLLLAHSMGGGIATLYIEEHKRVFEAAALCSPMHEPDLGILPALAVEGIAALRELKGKRLDYAGKGGPYSEEPFAAETAKQKALTHSRQRYERIGKMFADHPQARVGGASYGWVDLAIDAAEDARSNAKEIEVPVLLLQATEDVAVTAKGQNQFRDNLNRAHPGRCSLVPINGAYHELLVESDQYRTQALERILAFFDEHALPA